MMSTVAALVAVVAILGLLMWFYQSVKGSGRKEAEGASDKRSAEHAREANAIDEETARVPESDLDSELR